MRNELQYRSIERLEESWPKAVILRLLNVESFKPNTPALLSVP